MLNDNITIFGNIMVTENYDMFKKIGGNRKLNTANYAKIVKSMEEEQLIILQKPHAFILTKQHIQLF